MFIPCILLIFSSTMANAAAILEEQVFAIFCSQQKLLHIPCTPFSTACAQLVNTQPRDSKPPVSLIPAFPPEPHVLLLSYLTPSIPQSLQTQNLVMNFDYTQDYKQHRDHSFSLQKTSYYFLPCEIISCRQNHALLFAKKKKSSPPMFI